MAKNFGLYFSRASGVKNSLDLSFSNWSTLSILSLYSFPPILSNICFPAGTPVKTNQGIIPIEKLNCDIHTIFKKKIVDVVQTINTDKYLICFDKYSLGNIPKQKTIISKNHRILYEGKMIPADNFTYHFKNVKKIKYTGEVLYNVVMENCDVMDINGMLCETLHPENDVAKIYKIIKNCDPEERKKLIKMVNRKTIQKIK